MVGGVKLELADRNPIRCASFPMCQQTHAPAAAAADIAYSYNSGYSHKNVQFKNECAVVAMLRGRLLGIPLQREGHQDHLGLAQGLQGSHAGCVRQKA